VSSSIPVRRRALAAVATASATLVALALAACGTTEDPAAADASPSVAATSTGPVDVTDERGTVHLDAPAAKVVSLEWGLTENLVALGVKPVGEADVKGYNTWDTVVPLDPSTADVGQRGEPSLEAIAALDPDLVVTTTDLSEDVIKQIEKTAPVVALRGSDAKDPIGHLRRTLDVLGDATGTAAKADDVLAAFDQHVADAKAKLADAGKAGAAFAMADGWLSDGEVSVRMYATGSFLGGVADLLGLKNAWTGAGDPDYGLATTDVEGLTKIGDATFLYVANDTDGGDAFVDGLSDNAVWKGLPFVKGGDVHRLPDGIWMFGGPASAQAWIDATVSALTA
jgi:iron complex transport system substrate-binding protein